MVWGKKGRRARDVAKKISDFYFIISLTPAWRLDHRRQMMPMATGDFELKEDSISGLDSGDGEMWDRYGGYL